MAEGHWDTNSPPESAATHEVVRDGCTEAVIRWWRPDQSSAVGPLLFEAREVATWNMDGKTYADLEPDVLMHGSVKWDGCSNLTIGEGVDYQLHYCSKRGARVIGLTLDAVYDLAAREIPGWHGE